MKVKEKGFTNGNSVRINTGRGMINGLTNGNGNKDGLINGNSGKEKKPPKSMMSSAKGRGVTWVAIGIVLLLVFGVFAISTNTMKRTDWNLIKKYVDVDMGPVDKAVNITKFAFHRTGNDFGFYLKFAGDFANTGEYQHLAFIMIDNDSNINTGYNQGYMGVDYIIRIAANNGTVSGEFMKFRGTNQHLWNWSNIEGVIVVKNGNVLTGAVDFNINPNAKIMVVAESRYSEDITPVVGIEKPALLVIQRPLDNGTLMLDLHPIYGAVNVTSISIYSSVGVSLSGPGLSGNELNEIGKVAIPKKIYIHVNTSLVVNRGISVGVKTIDTSVPVTLWGNAYKKYIGTPTGIQIDGCFADWNHLVGAQHFNYNPTGNVANPNIDLYQYAMYNKGGDYFYASVTGTMLAGNIAPEMATVSTGWVGNTTPINKAKSPYDYAEITFVTKTGSTHVIQVFGLNGKVMRVLFDGKPSNSVQVGVGKNGNFGAIEIGVSGDYNIQSYTIKMTDWNGLSDVGHAHAPQNNGRSAGPYATPEFNMGYLIILLLVAIPIINRKRKS